MTSISICDIEAAAKKIDELSKDAKWVVIKPNGQIYSGSYEDIVGVVLQDHPLLKPISSFPFMNVT